MAQYYEGRQCRVGMALESTFGTRIVDGGTFTEIRTEPAEMDFDIKTDTIPGAGGVRAPLLDNVITYDNGAMPSIKVNGPLSIYEADVVFACALQSVTEQNGTPYAKIFVPAANMPDFAAGTGQTNWWTATIMKRYPVASTSVALTSAIVESFKLSCERGSYAKLETTWKSLKPAEYTANPSGTWERGLVAPGGASGASTKYGMKFFSGSGAYGIGTATININGGGANALTLQNFALTYNQTVNGEGISGGVFTNYSISNIGGTLEFKLLKDSISESVLAGLATGLPCEVIIGWGTSPWTADYEFALTMQCKTVEYKVEEDGILACSVKADLGTPAAGTDMLKIELCNLSHRTWPHPA